MDKFRLRDTVATTPPPWWSEKDKEEFHKDYGKTFEITEITSCGGGCSDRPLCPGRINGKCFGYSTSGLTHFALTQSIRKNLNIEEAIEQEVSKLGGK